MLASCAEMMVLCGCDECEMMFVLCAQFEHEVMVVALCARVDLLCARDEHVLTVAEKVKSGFGLVNVDSEGTCLHRGPASSYHLLQESRVRPRIGQSQELTVSSGLLTGCAVQYLLSLSKMFFSSLPV
jgi:hypothetical protein